MLKSTEKTNRTASCAGIEIGSVSVKIASRYNDATSFSDVLRHEGKPVDTVRKLMEACSVTPETKSVITGSSARELINLPYQSESECFEKSIEALNIDADILVSLGGESFSVYTLKDRRINTIISSTKCAAGTGEFIVQQFQRMGFTL